MKILFVSAEVAPFAKLGGLGDVVGSLPKALAAMGHDVRVVLPAYQPIENAADQYDILPFTLNVPIRDGDVHAGVMRTKLPGSDVPVYFIAQENLLGRPNIYGYDDDAYRFAFFSRAALTLTQVLDWQPDIVHAHDWHAALAIFWLATAGQQEAWFRPIKTVYTIHNLAHRGEIPWDVTHYLNIRTTSLPEEGYGQINVMARGIYHAGHITTVSPTYAAEIMTWDGGAGMDSLLRSRSQHVSGILNGLDLDVWNPASDPRLPHHFDRDSLYKKLALRHILQDRAGLPRRDNVPLIGMVSRLVWQKGIDIIGHPLHRLLSGEAGEAQFIILGTGEAQYENTFRLLEKHHPGRMAAFLDYNSGFAPIVYGGSDMFLMPSLFEPCGLGQMIAMRHGTIPVARNTGGLRDTIVDGETGFLFNDYNSDGLWFALNRAVTTYYDDHDRWHTMQQAGMAQDFSWTRSAKQYEALYQSLTTP